MREVHRFSSSLQIKYQLQISIKWASSYSDPTGYSCCWSI